MTFFLLKMLILIVKTIMQIIKIKLIKVSLPHKYHTQTI